MHHTLRIGTFNVISLASKKILMELTYMLQNIKIDILGLAEVRRTGYAIEEHEDYIFCYKGETLGLYGVGFLIKKEHKHNIVSFSAFSEYGHPLLKIKYNNQLITIIQVYAPTEKATEEEINSFYETAQPKRLRTDEDILSYFKNLEINKQKLETQEKDIQTFYDNLVSIIASSVACISIHKQQKSINKILSEPTKTLLKRRTELLKTKQKTKEMKKELSTLFKTTSKAIDKDYKDHRYKIIEENIYKHRSTKRAYKKLTTHKSWIQNLRSKTKETKTRKDIINCATDYYKQLYTKPTPCLSSITATSAAIPKPQSVIDLPPVDEKEVFKHIRKLKTDKSPRPDGIQNEVLKAGITLLTSPLTYLFNEVLNTGQVPTQWRKSDIVLLYKKGDPEDISNYRPISLLSSVYKIFMSILQSRLGPTIDNHQPVEQADSVPDFLRRTIYMYCNK
ncbi:unnamed protein product [Pieris macdunnoughi]|uniref:Uncharacterized protein n=1 Tax=Pieris macdunnoughi TaxID=345717 RepID=A0A821XYT3_9NEOP|nr:unnamed protein product [Pieris macdunnoughi]